MDKAAGLPTVTVRLDLAGAIVITEPAVRIERRAGEQANNFRKRVARQVKKRGFAIGTFEAADGSAMPANSAPDTEGGEEGGRRLQIIYLHGRDPLGRALGPNGFQLQREPAEPEENFRVRAMQAAAAKRLPWLAFEKPALPAPPALDDGEAA